MASAELSPFVLVEMGTTLLSLIYKEVPSTKWQERSRRLEGGRWHFMRTCREKRTPPRAAVFEQSIRTQCILHLHPETAV